MKNVATEQDLRTILEANNLPEIMAGWTPVYNKKADMFEAGTSFPEGSFYFPIDDTGVMLRIDNNNKIYGFAIENVKVFMRENPEFAFVLSSFVSPLKFRLNYIVMLFTYRTKLAKHAVIKNFADYFAGRALYSTPLVPKSQS